MEATNKNYCIILAGGIGRRLWPVSTKEVPKQFLDFFGTGKSLLQQTFERFVRFIPRDHIFVSTYQNYVPLVSEQLPDLPGQNILPEPVQLNTAPAAIWGTWHTVEKGTNPAFLFQQNTMRDAVAAAVTLNIFNRHSDKVIMANLAQMVNVLQSMVLTDGPKMLLTPTYHVFDLYRAHQDATLIESHALHDLTGPAESPVPLMDVSASVDAQGAVHVTAVNLSADEAVSTRVLVPGMDSARVRVRTLSGDIHAHNTFDAPEQVKPAQAEETALRQGECTVTLPPCSVTELTITQERR